MDLIAPFITGVLAITTFCLGILYERARIAGKARLETADLERIA